MTHLSANWMTEGHLDYEYKKYVLLAYLKSVWNDFGKKRLYPTFSELIDHYKAVMKFRRELFSFEKSISKEIEGMDLAARKLLYKQPDRPELLQEMEKIINYADRKMGESIRMGKELFDAVEEKIRIEPVGLLPIRRDEGYLFLEQRENVLVFSYSLSSISADGTEQRGLYTHFIRRVRASLSNTPEAIKQELIQTNRNLPNPATYIATSTQSLPVGETLLPVTKRLFLQYVLTR